MAASVLAVGTIPQLQLPARFQSVLTAPVQVAGLIVKRRLALVLVAQGLFGVAVSLMVTVPVAISKALGVYTGFKAVVLLNVPVPVVLQT
jgi:hypothetical protein